MRLTLRTLLAYVDDILEPADHEELGKKIESSDFATDLIHRTRDTVRRLRLGSPPVLAEDSQDVLGGDVSVDANTVAEYLDNTLPPEQVADYERVCIEPGTEADIHLAEVASCHHILTMVLGEPAEISTEVRDRMYNLPQELERRKTLRIEPAHQPVTEKVAAPPAPAQRIPIAPVAPSQDVDGSNQEVPDYLRAATRKRHLRIRMVAAAVILVMVAGIAYFLRPVDEPVPPEGIDSAEIAALGEDLDIVIGEEPAAESAADSDFPTDTAETEAAPFEAEVAIEENEVDTISEAGSDEMADSTTIIERTELPLEPIGQSPDASTNPGSAELSSDSTLAENAVASATNPLSPSVTQPGALTGLESPGSAVSTSPDEVSVGEPAPLPPAPAGSDTALVGESETAASDTIVPPSPEPELPPEPEPPARVGNYLGGSADVLLRQVGDSLEWIRLPPRTPIIAGDRLVALPTFRPHIALEEANLYVAGGTHLSFVENLATDEPGEFAIDIQYGRVLINAGFNGGPLKLVFGDQTRVIELGGSAGLAADVKRVFIPGTNFEQERAPVEVIWYLTSGSVEWPGQGGGTQTISAPMQWTTLEGVDELPTAIEKLPEWIDREQLTNTERRARDTLAEELDTGKPVSETLLELTDSKLGGLGRRREVRTLASSCSLHVGNFHPFVQSLSDVDQSRAWEGHIDSLRTALSVSPEVASLVRQAFEDIRGTEATTVLMEMVGGYSPQDIGLTAAEQQNGILVDLLGWLDSDSLDYRVLAIYNLNKIAEVPSGSNLADYQPYAESRQRERSLRRLWQRFESNELLPSR